MNYKIIRSGNIITLELAKNKSFKIVFDHFASTKDFQELKNCCDLFIHIKQTGKECVDDNLFYELATMVNEELPNHKINWISTFIAIEQENYSNHLINDDEEEDEYAFENIDSLYESDEILNDEFSKPEVRNGLLEQVSQKLKKKGIIK